MKRENRAGKSILVGSVVEKGEQKIHEDAFIRRMQKKHSINSRLSKVRWRKRRTTRTDVEGCSKRKKRKAAVWIILIEQAPQNAMYLAEGGSGFGGGYYDVGSGNASMSLGMGGFR